jgi:amphi-Trp domain-containing protein
MSRQNNHHSGGTSGEHHEHGGAHQGYHGDHRHREEHAPRRHLWQHEQHPFPRVEAHTAGSPQEIAGYLDELAAALRKGGVTVCADERTVGLRVGGDVTLTLWAAADGGTSQIDLSLNWQTPQPPRPPMSALSISAFQPPETEPSGHESGAGDSGPRPPSEPQGEASGI